MIEAEDGSGMGYQAVEFRRRWPVRGKRASPTKIGRPRMSSVAGKYGIIYPNRLSRREKVMQEVII